MTFAATQFDRVQELRTFGKAELGTLAPWLAGFLLWTILGLLSATETAVFFASEGREIPWTPLLIDRMADWYSCGIFTPVFFLLARRLLIDREGWRRAVPLNLALIAVCVPLKYLIYIGVMHTFAPTYRNRAYDTVLFQNFISEAIAFAATIGIIHAIVLDRR